MSGELGPGSRVGQYVLEEQLGGGSFGAVWRARDAATNDPVAVKLLTGAFAETDHAAVRTEVEVLAATASSESPHVVRVIGGGVEPAPYIVMEFVEGQDLARVLRERGTLPADETIRVGLGIADALRALKTGGIVHRDIKPANVMIDTAGTVKVADFGIAKIVGFDTITMTGQLPMTMAYAAPEVWDGEATHQSDLYAMGILLYQCLVGVPPFSGNYGALYKHHTSTLPDLTALPASTPGSLRELIEECLEKDPAARPPDAAACIRLLDRANAELTSPLVQEPAQFGPWMLRRPHPTLPWAWRCEHETTREPAVVEVHAFATIAERAPLQAAVNANEKLANFGAERLLGMNRVLLRPGESWRDEPAGAFQFWVARHEVAGSPTPAEVSVPRLRRAADALLGLLTAAEQQGVKLSLAPHLVSMQQDGGVLVRRPGLVPGSDPWAEAMTFLRGLPLDEDARRAVDGAADLRDLRFRLPAAPFVADVLGGTVTLDRTSGVGGGDGAPPRGDVVAGDDGDRRRRGVLGIVLTWPYRYRMAAVAAVAVVLGVGVVWGASALVPDGDRPSPDQPVALARTPNPSRTATARAGDTIPTSGTPGVPAKVPTVRSTSSTPLVAGMTAIPYIAPPGGGTAPPTEVVGGGGGTPPTARAVGGGTGTGGDPTPANTAVVSGGQAQVVVTQPPPPPPTNTPPPTPTTPPPATATPDTRTETGIATDGSWKAYDGTANDQAGPGAEITGGAATVCRTSGCAAEIDYQQGNGSWPTVSGARPIWRSDVDRTDPAVNGNWAYFKKTFTYCGPFTAKLHYGADNGWSIWLDGHYISGYDMPYVSPTSEKVYDVPDGTFGTGCDHTILIWGVNADKQNPGTTYQQNPAMVVMRMDITPVQE